MNDYKFRHNFWDTVNPLCLCNTEVKTANHYLLRFLWLLNEERNSLNTFIILITLYSVNVMMNLYRSYYKDPLNVPDLRIMKY